ncbi:signal recognition particle-docking protein FtsY [Candidatus Viadribacter manganicus]|uniref:signal recognition particle-docking protein FtsY n=1 Tax=Candidatus Viadribacter manganicus TaxID=1759059 RepID=UPI0009F2C520|nr:signal recognition particle-docking protein FtsY [Candidatus Viadribacter manganicus]
MIWGLFDKKKKQAQATPEQTKGLFDGLRKSSAKLADSFTSVFTKERLDASDIAELEETLIASDMGAAAAARISTALADQRFSKENGALEAREALAIEVARILKSREATLDLTDGPKPRIVLVIGVNGSGKTTTIGKLTKNLTDAGAKVVIGAADTFRAAAIEQLKVWADRAGASFVASTQGADAAGVAFETVRRAKQEGADVALIDTAGRLQNKSELMAELAKIIRVMRKVDEDAPHETLLVLDATVGQNALSQVENFRSVTEITGLVMTKLDGTAKGGVLVALAQRHAIPIHFIGVGEKAEDLQTFDALTFSRALVGLNAQ